MNQATKILLALLVLAFALRPATADQSHLATPAETASGLKLGMSGVHNILSVLGPAMVFTDAVDSGKRRMCYVSTADDSLIGFVIEHNILNQILFYIKEFIICFGNLEDII